jgi:alpha-glucosidase
MADAGYDIADYRDIDPMFGTLAEAEKLIAEAHARGIRIIVDIVPNHCSDQHPWFQEALAPSRARRAAGSGSGPAAGPRTATCRRTTGSPHFGGPAWTRVTEPDGTPGQWYLHLFAPEQPDLNWEHPAVREEFEDILRFWFDRGVDGFRIDSAAMLVKDPTCPTTTRPPRPGPAPVHRPGRHPRDLPGVARRRRLLRRAARADRRGLAARPAALREVPAPGRDAHRLQLPFLPAPGTRRRCAR